MALTVGQLVELLKGYPSEMPVMVFVETLDEALEVSYLQTPESDENVAVCISGMT